MSVRERILAVVESRPDMTEIQIAEAIYGRNHRYEQIVNGPCRQLVKSGHLARQGEGRTGSPFTYRATGKPDV